MNIDKKIVRHSALTNGTAGLLISLITCQETAVPIRIWSISLYFPDCMFGEDRSRLAVWCETMVSPKGSYLEIMKRAYRVNLNVPKNALLLLNLIGVPLSRVYYCFIGHKVIIRVNQRSFYLEILYDYSIWPVELLTTLQSIAGVKIYILHK